MTEQVNDQVTDTQAQDQGLDQAKNASLGWRASLSDEYKEHEWIKGFDKPTKFAAAAVDLKTQHEALEAKMKDAIFKPGKGATDEELIAYRKAMNIPEGPDGYEFPKTEGVEHDDEMMKWAGTTFHAAGLSKEQGALISQAWDKMVDGMVKAEQDALIEGIKNAETVLKAEWGAEYDGNLELMTRAYKYFEEKINGFKDFLETESVDGKTLGNHPAMIRAFYVIGKAMGEDISPKATPEGGDDKKPLGMNYEGMDHFRD